MIHLELDKLAQKHLDFSNQLGDLFTAVSNAVKDKGLTRRKVSPLSLSLSLSLSRPASLHYHLPFFVTATTRTHCYFVLARCDACRQQLVQTGTQYTTELSAAIAANNKVPLLLLPSCSASPSPASLTARCINTTGQGKL